MDPEDSGPPRLDREGGLWSSEEGSGDSASFNEWLFVEESSWGSHQSSTSWVSDEASLDVVGRGRFHTLGGGSPVRAPFPSPEVRRLASPPNLFYQTRTLGFLPISGSRNSRRNPPKIFPQIHRAQPLWRPPRKCGSRLARFCWEGGLESLPSSKLRAFCSNSKPASRWSENAYRVRRNCASSK